MKIFLIVEEKSPDKRVYFGQSFELKLVFLKINYDLQDVFLHSPLVTHFYSVFACVR